MICWVRSSRRLAFQSTGRALRQYVAAPDDDRPDDGQAEQDRQQRQHRLKRLPFLKDAIDRLAQQAGLNHDTHCRQKTGTCGEV